ncbi:MAG: hypothetical protein AAB263_13835, partial [Planctomycetota bacterium]
MFAKLLFGFVSVIGAPALFSVVTVKVAAPPVLDKAPVCVTLSPAVTAIFPEMVDGPSASALASR